jgi:ABC-type antimicrobial peptide transport system permease subunit
MISSSRNVQRAGIHPNAKPATAAEGLAFNATWNSISADYFDFHEHLDANLELWIVRAAAALFTVFGVLAFGLAVIGLYGVKAYAVARRTREIGIRMALGAQRGEVLRLFVREGSITLVSGIGLGLLLAVATGKILSELLYQVSPTDPIAFVSSALLLGVAALAATWIPACNTS